MSDSWFENREKLSTERLEEIKSFYQGEIDNLNPSSEIYENAKSWRSRIIDGINETLESRKQTA